MQITIVDRQPRIAQAVRTRSTRIGERVGKVRQIVEGSMMAGHRQPVRDRLCLLVGQVIEIQMYTASEMKKCSLDSNSKRWINSHKTFDLYAEIHALVLIFTRTKLQVVHIVTGHITVQVLALKTFLKPQVWSLVEPALPKMTMALSESAQISTRVSWLSIPSSITRLLAGIIKTRTTM